MRLPAAWVATGFAVLFFGILAGCSAPQVAQGIHDPYEAQNRNRYRSSITKDRAVLRPVAVAYGTAVPAPLRTAVSNVAKNLSLPGSVVNDLLQANIDDALHNATRFLFNSTIGLLGVLDPSTSMGLHARDSDFGETLHVWGAPEGAYLVLPIIGPSTERDAVGELVDLFTNPLGYVLAAPEKYVSPATRVLEKFGERYRFRSTIDSILYDSADSYSQSRLLYLEKRRFELGGAPEDTYFDPYEDPYAQ